MTSDKNEVNLTLSESNGNTIIFGYGNLECLNEDEKDELTEKKEEIGQKKEFNRVSYSVIRFFRDLKREISKIIGYRVNYRRLSTNFLLKNSPWHVNDLILRSRADKSYKIHKILLNSYEQSLKAILESEFTNVEKILTKYYFLNKFDPKVERKRLVNKDYFNELDTKEKLYLFYWLLAEAHVQVDTNRIIININTEDGFLIKKFITAIKFNPKYVKYDRRAYHNNEGKLSIQYRLNVSFADKDFVRCLEKNGFPIGKKSAIIRFMYTKGDSRELALVSLLGFFDGDGSHGHKYPTSNTTNTPTLKTKSRQFLVDVANYFGLDYKITEYRQKGDLYFQMNIGTQLFNEMLDNYDDSLPRKRVRYYTLEEARTRQLAGLGLPSDGKLRISYNDLKTMYDRGWSNPRIAEFHKKKYNIAIDAESIRYWAKKWDLQQALGPSVKRRVTIELMDLGWTLERVYTEEFGYIYDPSNPQHRYNLRQRLKEWFANDPLIRVASDIVAIIKQIYGSNFLSS